MSSLLDIASSFVGENAAIYSVGTLNDLPGRVLDNLLPYLCAYHLHEITKSKTDWARYNNLWQKHVQKRWNRSSNVMNHIFSDTEKEVNFHTVYLSKHFLDLLNFCCQNCYRPDPHGLFMCPLHKLQPWNMPHNTDPQSFHHLDQLIFYSTFAETLSVVGSQCSWICANRELLQNLLRVTRTINIHVITDLYYEGVRTLLWMLINHGILTEATFSSITSTLSKVYVLDLLQICAGISVTATLQNSDVNVTNSSTYTATNTLKRKRDSVNKPSPSKFKTVVKLDSDYDSPCAKKICIRLDDPDNSPNQSVISIETSEEIPSICDVIDFTNVDAVYNDDDDDDDKEGHGDDDDKSTEKFCKVESSHISQKPATPSISPMTSSFIECENDQNNATSYHRESYEGKVSKTELEMNTFDDLYDEAVQPVHPTQGSSHSKVFNTNFKQNLSGTMETRMISDSPFPVIDCFGNNKGLTSFAMTCNQLEVGNELNQVFPQWTSLKKFALFYTDICSEDLTEMLMEKVRKQQLTHLVLDDANFHVSFFGRLLHNLQENYSDPESDSKPLQLIDLQASTVFLEVEQPVTYKGPQFGVVKLDLSMNTLAPSGLDGLLNLIQFDNSLTHLKLNGCFLQEHQVVVLLQALSERKQLQMLGLSGNRVTDTVVEMELILFLKAVTSLKCLLLNYSRLRSQFVCSTEFVNAVKNHPSLHELSLKNNHLEWGACKLLSAVCCCERKIMLRSLNIGYNWIKTSDLIDCANEIRSFKESQDMWSTPALDFLSISGNRLQHWSQEQVRQSYKGLVRELEVDSIDYSSPYAEHLGQM